MTDYIKREEAEKIFVEYNCVKYHVTEMGDTNEANRIVLMFRENAKSLFSLAHSEDVAPVRHGRWEVVDAEEPRRYGCSECKRLSWNMENYCPNCGARMDGGENDEID